MTVMSEAEIHCILNGVCAETPCILIYYDFRNKTTST